MGRQGPQEALVLPEGSLRLELCSWPNSRSSAFLSAHGLLMGPLWRTEHGFPRRKERTKPPPPASHLPLPLSAETSHFSAVVNKTKLQTPWHTARKHTTPQEEMLTALSSQAWWDRWRPWRHPWSEGRWWCFCKTLMSVLPLYTLAYGPHVAEPRGARL